MNKTICLFFLVCGISIPVLADSLITIRDIESGEAPVPIYQNEDGDDTIQAPGLTLNQDEGPPWFRVAVRYESEPEWLDDLTLEFYLLFDDSETGKMVFKGSVDYVDIPKGRDHLAEMYLHANSYQRYGTRRAARVGVVAKIGEKVVATDRRTSVQNPWWKGLPTHSAGLLNRLDTPFRTVNPGSYQAQRMNSTR